MEVGKTYMRVKYLLDEEGRMREPGLIKLQVWFSMAADFKKLFADYVRTHRSGQRAGAGEGVEDKEASNPC
jgi:hypothetical protein